MPVKIKKIRNPIVLLGAGASKPAGVPTATEMTAKMLKRCEGTEFDPPLRAIIGALQMQQSRSRRRPDVENVMNATALLADRLSLEFAPFVGAWHPIIEDLERKPFRRSDATRISREAIKSWRVRLSSRPRNGGNDVVTQNQVARAIERALFEFAKRVDRRPYGESFRLLSAHLTGLLMSLTSLNEPKRLEYLDPLLVKGKKRAITIATLNYDNGVELRAEWNDIECHTGLSDWSSTGTLPTWKKGLQLLKLHGSVNWVWETPADGEHSLLVDRKVREIPLTDFDDSDGLLDTANSGEHLAVLFGGRNKLTAEGPFLDLLSRFKSELFQRSGMVVIGYSFRDPHINHYILRWLQSDRNRRIIIIDAPGAKRETHPFLANQEDALGSRVTFVAKGAKKGIELVFG